MIRNIFLSILEISLSTGLAVALFLLLIPLFNKRYAVRWSCYIWIFIALRLLVPFSWGSIADSMQRMPFVSAEKEETKDTTLIRAPRQRIIIDLPEPMTTEITVQKEERKSITLLDSIAYVWIAGCIGFLAIPVFSCIRYRIKLAKGRAAGDERIKEQLCKLTAELRIRRQPPVIIYEKAHSPMVTGIFKPVLVLPKETYGEKELYFILKHELVHLKRHDTLVKFLYIAANALHWFNPLIYIMRRQAVADMELSCDEKVIAGAAIAERRKYTDTLFSTVAETCMKTTALTTEFYGGKEIMKKRFKNILTRTRKKNGLLLFLAAMVLTLEAGTLVGCGEKENPASINVVSETSSEKENPESINVVPVTSSENSDKNNSSFSIAVNDEKDGDIKHLIIIKEGGLEVKEASRTVGVGYSIYIPDGKWKKMSDNISALPDDAWQTDGRDVWSANINDKVQLRVTHYTKLESAMEIKKAFLADGYEREETELVKRRKGLVTKVRLYEHDFEDDTWSVIYSYPQEAEEGFGQELPVIADTFAVDARSQDSRDIYFTVKKFAIAYFTGDKEEMKNYLADSSEANIETYRGNGTAGSMTIKGLANNEVLPDGAEKDISLEFMDNTEDSYSYLTLFLVKQEDGWKIRDYGLEK